jgi:Mg chelatase-related protein
VQGTPTIGRAYSVAITGIDAHIISVEVDTSRGYPGFNIVGFPDSIVRESRDRVVSAISNSGIEAPSGKVTVNLAPASIKKIGASFDLPIAVGILNSLGKLPALPEKSIFIGELSLSGQVRHISGAISVALKAKESGFTHLFLPQSDAAEVASIDGLTIIPLQNIRELIDLTFKPLSPQETPQDNITPEVDMPDFSDVRGQTLAKEAAEIACAGGHNLLMIGPPGSGKSMIASRLSGILPPLSESEAIETTKIYSVAGMLPSRNGLMKTRPFRSPHHSASSAGIVGGGKNASPGEITLAHNGVLFMDEFPEFDREIKEVLRQPLETDVVTISRANATITYPCSFMLVAAMNPCPCGNYQNPKKNCSCSPVEVKKYLARISAPLRERIDLHVAMSPVEYGELADKTRPESSETIRARVLKARSIQEKRYAGKSYTCNAKLPDGDLKEFCKRTQNAVALLKDMYVKHNLSARSFARLLKVARTIADLDGAEIIHSAHVTAALRFRESDNFNFVLGAY